MNFKYITRKLALLGGTMIVALPSAVSALTITPTTDSDLLADSLFLNVPGLTITSTVLSGFDGQSGTYTNEAGTYGLPNAGIVLSSGNVSDYETGPSGSNSNTTSYGNGGGGEGDFDEGDFGDDGPQFLTTSFAVSNAAASTGTTITPEDNTATPEQQDLLGPITGKGSHFDVVQLDINFDADAGVDSVTFFATFGSEEFPEFANTSFADGFGLFVNGTNVAGVNSTTGEGNLPVNIDHPDFQAFAGTELDGVLAPGGNPVLQFDVPISAGENTFTIILADASDSAYDTTTYISSFLPTDVPSDPGNGGPTGTTEFDPLLPDNPPDPVTGEFVISLPFDDPTTLEDEGFSDGDLIWLDPPVTTGYTYSIQGSAAQFETITAPSFATVADLDGYSVLVNGMTLSLTGGQTIDFGAAGVMGPVTSFVLSGIDTSLMLDPADTMAFPLGASFSGLSATTTISIIPTTDGTTMTPVPLPAGGALYLGGMLLLGGLYRRGAKRRA